MTKEEMIESANNIKKLSKSGVGRIMDGLYMEGPFMSLMGSFQNQIKWQGAICEEDYVDLVEALGDMVRVWAIDPNRKNIEKFMAYAKERTPHVIFAHGHSRATFESIEALKHFGVKLRTHINDSGQAPGRAQGCLGAGGDQFCLYDPDMYAELICDESGVHVAPGLIKMIVRTKGVERICLISDHTTVKGELHKNNEELGIWYGPDLNYDDEGKLAGSLMTLENGVRNMMIHTGYGLCHAIRCATLNPARMLGLDNEIGSLDVGKKANIILIDDTVRVKRVILEGECVVS
jgi:N-acetylglucosamine-6-phosphate deacetylase